MAGAVASAALIPAVSVALNCLLCRIQRLNSSRNMFLQDNHVLNSCDLGQVLDELFSSRPQNENSGTQTLNLLFCFCV